MLGTVTMLRRYPVKSMLGEDVPASDVTGKGLAHDRALALVHRETGKVASENDWAGHDLRIGSDLTLRVMSRTPRCAIPTLEHGDLPRDTAALRVLADHNRVIPVEPLAPQPCAGAYAQVLQPGRNRVGDVVRLADGQPALVVRLHVQVALTGR
jgi:uncharacterized protein YcbX